MNKAISGPTILLIDDNETDNLITKRIIELSGFSKNIVTTNSGRGGLDYLRENENNQDALPDLIFLDINMPVVGGFMFLYEYEKMAPKLSKAASIVILSSSDNQAEIELLIENQFVLKYVIKPLNQATVSNIASLFNNRHVKVA